MEDYLTYRIGIIRQGRDPKKIDRSWGLIANRLRRLRADRSLNIKIIKILRFFGKCSSNLETFRIEKSLREYVRHFN